jgi:hypothetical protein
MIKDMEEISTMAAQLDHYLIMCGLAVQSRQEACRYFGRWISRLQIEGHTSIGHLAVANSWSWEEIQTGNWIDLFLAQRSGNESKAHELRNLTGVRPPKP